MQLSLALLSLLVSTAAAAKIDLTKDISASSRLGQKLMSKARRLANDDDEVDYTWLADYSLQFQGCSSVMQFGGQGEQGGNNNKNGQSNLYEQSIVKFAICPTNSCTKGTACSGGGEYVVEMFDFVNAYTEAQLDYQEYMCEQIRENCACDDDANDDEACQNQCYVQAGWQQCIDEEDEFDLQEYLECNEVKFEDNDDDNEYEYWAAPYCAKGGNAIYLGLYEDEDCTQMAASGTYESINKYGYALPYSYESIVKKDCVSCLEPQDNQNQNDQQDEDQVIEICEEVYMAAGKCEQNMDVMAYPDTDACEYIYDVLPRLEADSSEAKYSKNSSGHAAKTFAFIFFFTTCGLLVALCLMYQNRSRSKVNLSGYEGSGTVA